MKKYILLIAASLMASFTYAQSNKEEVDLMQAAFGMDKKAAVAEFVKPSPAQKDAFWKLYDEYETQRKELGKQRITLLRAICKPVQDNDKRTGRCMDKKSYGSPEKN